MEGQLAGRVALITGGAGSIGQAITARFRAAGAHVAILDAQPPKAAGEDDLLVMRGDVASSDAVRACITAIASRWGRLHILITCAGRYAEGPLEEMPEQEWDALWATNVRGVYVCTREALPLLRHTGGPGRVILHIASSLAVIAEPEAAAYCASKAAVVMLTRTLGLAYAPEGIRVNALCPGPVDGPMLAAEIPDEGERRALARLNPLGRFASVDEVAGLALYLASDAAAYATAAVYPLDGGETALGASWSALRRAGGPSGM